MDCYRSLPLRGLSTVCPLQIVVTEFGMRESRCISGESIKSNNLYVYYFREGDLQTLSRLITCKNVDNCKKKCMFLYLAQSPVHWTAQGALHFTPGKSVHSGTKLTSLGNILAMQQLRAKTNSLHFHHCLDSQVLIYTTE